MTGRSLSLAALHLALAFVLALALGFPSPANAGKPDPRGERDEVGGAISVDIQPSFPEIREAGAARTWTDLFEQRGASFLKPHFAEFNLLPGDVLTVINSQGRVIEELKGRGPKDRGSFWGLSSFGDVIVFELTTRNDYAVPPFRIDQMIVGEDDLFAPPTPFGNPESICAPGDFEDVLCYQGDGDKWDTVFSSVGVMSVGGNPATALFCSGSNVSPNNYLLTNQHCIENQGECDNAEFVFKYYRTGCNDGSPVTADWESFRCDEQVAVSPFAGFCDPNLDNLDFSLSSVIGDPASTYGFVTPDPTPLTDGEAIYIVQHPDGRPHEITHGSGANVDVDGTTLRYYDTLDTEGGSSGSPIFRESDNKLVGLHHCGGCSTPGTGNRGMMMSDIYPHIESFLCTTSLSISSASAQNLAEVTGNGDTFLEPGETWQFTPVLRNAACTGDAAAVTADLQMGTGSVSITLGSPTASFGTIAAGASASASAPVQFTVGSGTCGAANEVVIDLVNIQTSSAAGPFADAAGYLSAPVGGQVWTQLFFEDFSGPFPGSWSIVDGGTGTGPAQTWTTANPDGRTLALTDPFAIADSDALGTGTTMDEELISQVIDASGTFDTLELAFDHHFRFFNGGGNEQADVDVRSTATGGVWTNVQNFSGADAIGAVAIDVSAQAQDQTDFQVRFHYWDVSFDWWWAVDDIYLRGGSYVCQEIAPLFSDGFESGSTSAWTLVVGAGL